MKRILLLIFTLLMMVSVCEARKKADTYVDQNGVKRVQGTGKIYRDQKAINDFKKKNPKPNDGHAYDIDHKKPLAQGGADKPSNMQWIRAEDHRKKTAKENRK